jgi:hypothetical protein
MMQQSSPGGAPTDAAPASAARTAAGACVLLGAAIALLTTTLPDAVLMPAVDRLPPRHLGMLLTVALLSIGWLAVNGRRERSFDRTQVLWLGAAAVLGGFLAAWLLPWLSGSVAAGLRGEHALPYYPLVALASAGTAAPLALPLGALAALCVGSGRRTALTALLFGAAVGYALGPYLAEVLLGPERSLQVCALLAGTVAVLLCEHLPRLVTPRRLPAGSAAALFAIGPALLIGTRLLEEQTDRGTLLGPVLIAVLCLGAVAGTFLKRIASLPVLLVAAALAVPLLFPAQVAVILSPIRDTSADLTQLALLALPPGVLLGALLAHTGRGLPLGLAPTLLVIAAPAVSWLLLPWLGPRATGWLLALPMLLIALRRFREHAVALIALLAMLGASMVGLGPAAPAGSTPALASVRRVEGHAALVADPWSGRQLLALDGHAPFGRSAAQERRFAHVPLLLHSPANGPLVARPDRVLVIASGAEQTAIAAWQHHPRTLHWRRPFPVPAAWDSSPWPGVDPPSVGGARQFLSLKGKPYDVIVMAPEPRAGRRAALVGTTEFYSIVRRAISPDGLFCQWWDLADMDVSDLKTVIASAQLEFEHCYLVMDHPRTRRAAIGLIGTRQPLHLPPERLAATLEARPVVAEDLAQVGLDGLSIASLLIADRGTIELLAPREDALHDERPTLGVRSALRSLSSADRLALGLATFGVRRHDPVAFLDIPAHDQLTITRLVRARFRGWQHLYGGTLSVVTALGLDTPPFETEPPGTTPEMETDGFLQALASLPDWPYLSSLVQDFATNLEHQSRPALAEQYLRRAIAADIGSAPFRYALAALVERKGDTQDAITLYRTALAFDPEHPDAIEALLRLGAPLNPND